MGGDRGIERNSRVCRRTSTSRKVQAGMIVINNQSRPRECKKQKKKRDRWRKLGEGMTRETAAYATVSSEGDHSCRNDFVNGVLRTRRREDAGPFVSFWWCVCHCSFLFLAGRRARGCAEGETRNRAT